MRSADQIKENKNAITIITWILRLFVGGLFVFSGFVKAVDPWGTIYKFDAYLQAFGLHIWDNLELVGVFGLCAVEFCIGIFIGAGLFRRSSVICALIIMAFMLPLSLWLAVTDSIEECGCFGEFIHISNWATFSKNIILIVGSLWLLKFNKDIHWGVTPALQWIIFLISAAFIIEIEFIGYMEQPMLDFLPYKIGEKLIDPEVNDDSTDFVFIYEKDGKQKDFKQNDVLPDERDGWVFIKRNEIHHNQSNISNSEKTFRIWDRESESDVSEEILEDHGEELIIMMPELKNVSPATTWKLNALYEWCVKNEIPMIAVVSGSDEEISSWEDLSMASYEIYTADDTQIKQVVRGNPGIVFLNDGNVKWKTSLKSLDVEEFVEGISLDDALSQTSYRNRNLLLKLTVTYLSIFALIVFLSFLPICKRIFLKRFELNSKKKTTNHDDMAHL